MNKTPFALLTLVAALAACSSVPDRNMALDAARSRHATVQAEPMVSQHAAEEMKVASAALAKAEKANAAGGDRADIDHLAYLANQRLSIVQETAASRAAQAVTAGAAAERDAMRLSMRTAEADAAQRALTASQQNSAQQGAALAQQGAALAQADRAALDARASLANRNAQVDSLQAELAALNARKTERGIVVTLGDMLFDTGRSELQAAGGRSISQLADFLKRQPQRQVAIEGYTDSVGSDSSNQSLSDRRAQSVMAALVSMGVGSERLRARGNGESSPVADNNSTAGRQMNRRVEVIFAAEAGDMLAK
jgi:outer membrane protein OmpA-like peptidoglycan-associated protein